MFTLSPSVGLTHAQEFLCRASMQGEATFVLANQSYHLCIEEEGAGEEEVVEDLAYMFALADEDMTVEDLSRVPEVFSTIYDSVNDWWRSKGYPAFD